MKNNRGSWDRVQNVNKAGYVLLDFTFPLRAGNRWFSLFQPYSLKTFHYFFQEMFFFDC